MKIRYPFRYLPSPSPNQALIASAVFAALAMPAAAQGPVQYQELPRMGLPADSDVTYSVALGDVDGDGDLAVGNRGSSTTFGVGTPNWLYLNLQRQLHAPAEPRLGLLYHLDAYLRYGPSSTSDLAAVYLSTGAASIAPPFGTLGIDLAMAAPFPTLVIPQPAGVGTVSFTVPNVEGLIGQEIYSQALLVPYPNDLRLSNVVHDVIR